MSARLNAIGTDPEFALLSKSGRKVLAACHHFPKPKVELFPRQMPEDSMYGRECWLEPDGTGAEFNSNQGYYCRAFLMDDVADGLKTLHDLLGFKVEALPAQQLLKSDMHGESMRSGCAPELYTKHRTTVPLSASKYRTFAGHIHMAIGSSLGAQMAESMGMIKGFITACDVIIGIPALLTSPWPDLERLRRRHYGGAGAYRWKKLEHAHDKYSDGRSLVSSVLVEYRTPSAAIFYHPFVAHQIFGLAQGMVGLVGGDGALERLRSVMKLHKDERVDDLINNFDGSAEQRAHLIQIWRQGMDLMKFGWRRAGHTDAYMYDYSPDDLIEVQGMREASVRRWISEWDEFRLETSPRILFDYLMLGNLTGKNPSNSTLYERWNLGSYKLATFRPDNEYEDEPDGSHSHTFALPTSNKQPWMQLIQDKEYVKYVCKVTGQTNPFPESEGTVRGATMAPQELSGVSTAAC